MTAAVAAAAAAAPHVHFMRVQAAVPASPSAAACAAAAAAAATAVRPALRLSCGGCSIRSPRRPIAQQQQQRCWRFSLLFLALLASTLLLGTARAQDASSSSSTGDSDSSTADEFGSSVTSAATEADSSTEIDPASSSSGTLEALTGVDDNSSSSSGDDGGGATAADSFSSSSAGDSDSGPADASSSPPTSIDTTDESSSGAAAEEGSSADTTSSTGDGSDRGSTSGSSAEPGPDPAATAGDTATETSTSQSSSSSSASASSSSSTSTAPDESSSSADSSGSSGSSGHGDAVDNSSGSSGRRSSSSSSSTGVTGPSQPTEPNPAYTHVAAKSVRVRFEFVLSALPAWGRASSPSSSSLTRSVTAAASAAAASASPGSLQRSFSPLSSGGSGGSEALAPGFPAALATEVAALLTQLARDVGVSMGAARALTPEIAFRRAPFLLPGSDSEPQDPTRAVVYADLADVDLGGDGGGALSAARSYARLQRDVSLPRPLSERRFARSPLLVALSSLDRLCLSHGFNSSTSIPSFAPLCGGGADPPRETQSPLFMHACYSGLITCVAMSTILLFAAFHRSRLLAPAPREVAKMQGLQKKKLEKEVSKLRAQHQALGLLSLGTGVPGVTATAGASAAGVRVLAPSADDMVIPMHGEEDDEMNLEVSRSAARNHQQHRAGAVTAAAGAPHALSIDPSLGVHSRNSLSVSASPSASASVSVSASRTDSMMQWHSPTGASSNPSGFNEPPSPLASPYRGHGASGSVDSGLGLGLGLGNHRRGSGNGSSGGGGVLPGSQAHAPYAGVLTPVREQGEVRRISVRDSEYGAEDSSNSACELSVVAAFPHGASPARVARPLRANTFSEMEQPQMDHLISPSVRPGAQPQHPHPLSLSPSMHPASPSPAPAASPLLASPSAVPASPSLGGGGGAAKHPAVVAVLGGATFVRSQTPPRRIVRMDGDLWRNANANAAATSGGVTPHAAAHAQPAAPRPMHQPLHASSRVASSTAANPAPPAWAHPAASVHTSPNLPRRTVARGADDDDA